MDLVFTMTTGGPGNVTEFIGIAIYRRAFVAFNMGLASTLALVTLLIAIAFTAIYLYVLKTKERQALLK
jgi:multiple sugar transport system permease protein